MGYECSQLPFLSFYLVLILVQFLGFRCFDFDYKDQNTDSFK